MNASVGMMDLSEIWRRIKGQVYPVILRSEIEEYPYHGVGTAFIVEHREQLFCISAQHVLDSQRVKADSFTIMVRDAGYSIVFDLEAVFKPEYDPHFDLLIRRIASFQREFLSKNGVYWMGTEFSIDPIHHEKVGIFYVFGYSEDHREYDYAEKRITADMSLLVAKLTTAAMDNMVTLQIVNEMTASLRGFSGSPVVAVIDGDWMFAGMLTLAVEATGIMNFIPAYRIVGYLEDLHERVSTGDLPDQR